VIRPACAAAVAAMLISGCASHYLRRAPSSPAQPWPLHVEPTGADETRVGASAVASDRIYSLPELIDLAESTNPDTRIGWERARQAALAVGVATADYFPRLAAWTIVGYQHTWLSVPDLAGATIGANPFQLLPTVQFPLPQLPKPPSRIGIDTFQVLPFLHLSWDVFKPGRGDDVRAAENLSTAANALFTAEHEKVIFEVARAYFRLSATRAQVAVNRDALERTRVIAKAAEARYGQGLATVVDTAEARREVVQGEYNVAQAQSGEIAAYAALVSALGIDPEVRVGVTEQASGPLPTRLTQPVTAYVHKARTLRADLRAARARLPATEAAVSKSRANYLPRVSLVGVGGASWLGGQIGDLDLPTLSLPNVGVFMNFEWLVFDGGLREVNSEIARSRNNEAVQELVKLNHQVVQEVVTAYNEANASLSRYQAATALFDTAATAEDAATKSYLNGLATLTDAMNAQKARSLASAAKEQAFAEALIAATTLSFAAGELISAKAVPHSP
jgi:outer membrane protein TolC